MNDDITSPPPSPAPLGPQKPSSLSKVGLLLVVYAIVFVIVQLLDFTNESVGNLWHLTTLYDFVIAERMGKPSSSC